MTLGTTRSISQIATAAFRLEHWRGVAGAVRTLPQPGDFLARHVFGRGTYPTTVSIRTPLGQVRVRVDSWDDIGTVYEVFCRRDYYVDQAPRVVVDIGGNIGLASLYFLTRSATSFVHVWEPVPGNVERLRSNLEGFENRYELAEEAIWTTSGMADFDVEETGRYGGLHRGWPGTIRVPCREVNEALESVLEKQGRIDVVKIDVEGDELALLRAIRADLLRHVRVIFAEGVNPAAFGADGFRTRLYANTLVMVR